VIFLGLGALKGDSGCLNDLDLKLARDLIDRFLSGVVGFSVVRYTYTVSLSVSGICLVRSDIGAAHHPIPGIVSSHSLYSTE
jgi:hypothetical protein